MSNLSKNNSKFPRIVEIFSTFMKNFKKLFTHRGAAVQDPQQEANQIPSTPGTEILATLLLMYRYFERVKIMMKPR